MEAVISTQTNFDRIKLVPFRFIGYVISMFSIILFQEEKGDKSLTKEELITISCGITFFLSFFIAMGAELKAKHAIHYIFKKFIRLVIHCDY